MPAEVVDRGEATQPPSSLALSHPAVEAPFTVAYLSDLQWWMPGRALSASEREALRARAYAGSLGGSDDAVVELLETVAANGPELLLLPGDLIDYYEPGALDFAAHTLGRLPIPAHVTLGNHDICHFAPPDGWTNNTGAVAAGIRQAWRQRLGATGFTYAFRHRGVRFIALDTSESRLFPADVEWLAAQLADDADTPTLLFYHVPAPLPALLPEVAQHRSRYYCLARDAATRRFLDLVAGHDCLLAGLCGHVHFASLHRWGAMAQMTIPPSCDGGHGLVRLTP